MNAAERILAPTCCGRTEECQGGCNGGATLAEKLRLGEELARAAQSPLAIDTNPTPEPSRWVSVTERLPERDVVVLTFESKGRFTSIEAWPRFGRGVTHWMAFPQAPDAGSGVGIPQAPQPLSPTPENGPHSREVERLCKIAMQLRKAGANLPAPEAKGTPESSILTGMSIALCLVETEIEEAMGLPPFCLESNQKEGQKP